MAAEASDYLVALARRISTAYVDQASPRAILLTGSAAAGISDYFSDLDLIAYYDHLPTEDQLAAARTLIKASPGRFSARRDEGTSVIEEVTLDEVACQMGHFTVAWWEREMVSVLEKCTPATLTEKAIMGLLSGVALHGKELIDRWQQRAAQYPEALARATVEHYLRLFPLWYVAEGWWESRDAIIFFNQMLAEVCLNLLGVLAGLNRQYFSTFEVKRLHRLAQAMRVAPERLADRLDELFSVDPVSAGTALEHLVEETLSLLETHMPEIDTISARHSIGVRHSPWSPRPG